MSSDTSIEFVKQIIGENERRREFIAVRFPNVIPGHCRERRFVAANLDCVLYAPMKAGLEFFYPRIPTGGILFLRGCSSGHWSGATKAVNRFCAATGELFILVPDKSESTIVHKSKSPELCRSCH